jgi:hypothetical protein
MLSVKINFASGLTGCDTVSSSSNLEDEGTGILRNVGSPLPKDTASHPRTLKSSVTLLWQTKLSLSSLCSPVYNFPTAVKCK